MQWYLIVNESRLTAVSREAKEEVSCDRQETRM